MPIVPCKVIQFLVNICVLELRIVHQSHNHQYTPRALYPTHDNNEPRGEHSTVQVPSHLKVIEVTRTMRYPIISQILEL
jgi:hypothetical protein